MAEVSRFFESQAPYNVAQFAETLKTLRLYGVISEHLNLFALTVTPGSLLLTIGSGAAVIDGFIYENDAPVALGMQANTSGATRQDYVAIRINRLQRTGTLVILTGTPGSGVPPTPVQVAGGIWEMPLFQVGLASGSTTPVYNVDARPFSSWTSGDIVNQSLPLSVFGTITQHNVAKAGATGIVAPGTIAGTINFARDTFFQRGEIDVSFSITGNGTHQVIPSHSITTFLKAGSSVIVYVNGSVSDTVAGGNVGWFGFRMTKTSNSTFVQNTHVGVIFNYVGTGYHGIFSMISGFDVTEDNQYRFEMLAYSVSGGVMSADNPSSLDGKTVFGIMEVRRSVS